MVGACAILSPWSQDLPLQVPEEHKTHHGSLWGLCSVDSLKLKQADTTQRALRCPAGSGGGVEEVAVGREDMSGLWERERPG